MSKKFLILVPLIVGGSLFAFDNRKIAETFAPFVQEHEDDKFPLINAKDLFNNAGIGITLTNKNGEKEEKVIVPPGRVPSTDLRKIFVTINGKEEPILASSPKDGPLDALYLIIPEELYSGKVNGRQLPPKCYAYVRPTLNGKAVDVSYVFFYAYNGTPSSGILGVTTGLKKLGVGHHEGDIEHVTVRLSEAADVIKGVMYARHGSPEHKWYTTKAQSRDSDDGYKMDGSQIVTWTARDTHGNSNRAGTLKRRPPIYLSKFVEMIGVLVEKTSDKGRKLNCRNHLEVIDSVSFTDPSSEPWLLFRGKWGRPKPPSAKSGGAGPTGLRYKDWLNEEPEGPR